MITFTRADHGHAVNKLSVTWMLPRVALSAGELFRLPNEVLRDSAVEIGSNADSFICFSLS
jgi:hypothetical protein